ncbi:MAG: hypothetical protein AAF655_02770 [Bacteroidota bacterium]
MSAPQDYNHRYEILYWENHNRVVFCHDCQAFHINFGMISLDLRRPAVESLMSTLHKYLQFYEGKVHTECRCVEVHTPYQGIRLLLSVSEIRALGNILYDACSSFWDREYDPRNN